jgi:hypothetical protein
LTRKLALYDFADTLTAEVAYLTESISFRLQDREFKGRFHVVSPCSFDVIVGLDWMAQNSALLDSATRRLLFPSAALWKLLRSEAPYNSDSSL